MLISQTPYRVSLFGGGTDFPEWFDSESGMVVSLAINKFCYISVRILPPFFEHNFRIVYSEIEKTKEFSEIKHPAVRNAIAQFAPNLNLEIQHYGDLPARSGIGSSSAFAVGIINALNMLSSRTELNPRELALKAINLERNVIKEKVGWQDQIACAYGGFNRIDFSNNDFDIIKLEPSARWIEYFEKHLLLVYTGTQRTSSTITENLILNMQANRLLLHEMIDIARYGAQMISSESDVYEIAQLINESHKLKKSVNNKTTNKDIENIINHGLTNGALGCKILGAGNGGFLLFIVEEHKQHEFRKALSKLTLVPINIEKSGSRILHRTREI